MFLKIGFPLLICNECMCLFIIAFQAPQNLKRCRTMNRSQLFTYATFNTECSICCNDKKWKESLVCHALSYTEKCRQQVILFPSQTYCMFQKNIQFPNAISVNFISAGLGSKHWDGISPPCPSSCLAPQIVYSSVAIASGDVNEKNSTSLKELLHFWV